MRRASFFFTSWRLSFRKDDTLAPMANPAAARFYTFTTGARSRREPEPEWMVEHGCE